MNRTIGYLAQSSWTKPRREALRAFDDEGVAHLSNSNSPGLVGWQQAEWLQRHGFAVVGPNENFTLPGGGERSAKRVSLSLHGRVALDELNDVEAGR